MMNLKAEYPSFLRAKPKVFGMELSEMFFLSGVLFLLTQLEVSGILILLILGVLYLCITGIKRLYPRRHFEFVFISKNCITMRDINEKLRL